MNDTTITVSLDEVVFLLALIKQNDPYKMKLRLQHAKKLLLDDIEKLKELTARARSNSYYERDPYKDEIEKLQRSKSSKKEKRLTVIKHIKRMTNEQKDELLRLLRS